MAIIAVLSMYDNGFTFLGHFQTTTNLYQVYVKSENTKYKDFENVKIEFIWKTLYI